MRALARSRGNGAYALKNTTRQARTAGRGSFKTLACDSPPPPPTPPTPPQQQPPSRLWGGGWTSSRQLNPTSLVPTMASSGAAASAMSESATHAEKLVDYLNASWTPYHATANARAKLLAAGYTELYENDVWNLKLGGRYFFTRNMSCLVAFAVGGKYKAGNGAIIVGAHTDSPCIKMKPHTASGKNGFVQLGVQPYGGGIWHTWFDRDLSVAGRVFVRRGDRTCHELVRIDRPIMCIPSLAIHLNRTVNKGFDINCQTHLPPILATELKSRFEMPVTAEDEKKASGGDSPDASALRHSPLLLKLLAEELKCKPEDILTFDLQLCDTQPSIIGGACREFIHSGRLDNLAMCYCATESLIETDHSLADETGIRMVALYDHEEVGSGSAYGARSPITIDVLRRVTRASCEATGDDGTDALERCVVNSFLVSADMAHGIHPNFADKHEPGHQPHMHKGMVIKTHCEMRYITDAFSQHVFHECGRRAGVPFQQFVVRSDCACGSTIGPALSVMAGVRGIDVGIPQFAMHSVREMCAVDDVNFAVEHMTGVFEHASTIIGEVDSKF